MASPTPNPGGFNRAPMAVIPAAGIGTGLLRRLLGSTDTNLLCIDQQIELESEQVKVITDNQMQVLEVGESVDPELALGVSIGIEKFGAGTAPLLFAGLAEMMDNQLHLRDNY
ncbi:hypothetical protein [Pseudosulfitobacter sp. DSM 107133]|uniref:hypothetical protein n=1 Tax=Pseudosulfitobacter sp. DSM 107133 TaxID=2883100 RepID=UPI0013B40988|nr:hypothetical protein [Pseudosulfitobacter sp. DSM 107133]